KAILSVAPHINIVLFIYKEFIMQNTKLINFYFNNGFDHEGRTLYDYHNFTNDQMENIHNYIQWMFPLNEPSFINEFAPIVTIEDTLFVTRNEHKLAFIDSLDKFCRFIFKEENRSRIFQSSFNHNHLRISRAIKSL